MVVRLLPLEGGRAPATSWGVACPLPPVLAALQKSCLLTCRSRPLPRSPAGRSAAPRASLPREGGRTQRCGRGAAALFALLFWSSLAPPTHPLFGDAGRHPPPRRGHQRRQELEEDRSVAGRRAGRANGYRIAALAAVTVAVHNPSQMAVRHRLPPRTLPQGGSFGCMLPSPCCPWGWCRACAPGGGRQACIPLACGCSAG